MIDVRRYQWMIGGFGAALVVAFSVYLFVHGGAAATSGVRAGHRLHRFVAPLASSDLDASANVHPHCNPARPATRGLNVCDRKPLALAFFTVGAGPCERSVDALQAISRTQQQTGIEFAAVAVGAGKAPTARLVRRNGWTIPVAYDLTGSVGALYDVSVCPLIELAGDGGVVVQRLVGDRWERPGALAARVRAFAAGLRRDRGRADPTTQRQRR